jgi:hypothetical protein
MYLSDVKIWLSDKAYALLSPELKEELSTEWELQNLPVNLYCRYDINRWEGSDSYTKWMSMFSLFDAEAVQYDYASIGEGYTDTDVRTGERFLIKREIGIIGY